MPRTDYTIRTDYGYLHTADASAAESYSRAGYRVTATTGDA